MKSEGPSSTHRTRVRLLTVEIASAKKSQFRATPEAEFPEMLACYFMLYLQNSKYTNI